MTLIVDAESLRDFLGYAIVYAPDFPADDLLEDDERMSLEYLMTELEKGLVFIPRVARDQERLSAARSMLWSAKAAFEAGDQLKGAEILQDLDRGLFG